MDREKMSKKVRVWLLERNALFGRTRDEADWLADHITDFAIEVGTLDGWVATSERLPKEQGEYLVVRRGSTQEVAIRFINPDEEGTSQYAKNYFTHWRPIPPAPDDGDKNESEK